MSWRPLTTVDRFWSKQTQIQNLSEWFTLECGAAGDCLFYVLAKGLSWHCKYRLESKEIWSMKEMRHVMAAQVNSVDTWVAHSVLPPVLDKLRPPETKIATAAATITVEQHKQKEKNESVILAHLRSWVCDDRAALRLRTGHTFKKLWGEVKFLDDYFLRSPAFQTNEMGFFILYWDKWQGSKDCQVKYKYRMHAIKYFLPGKTRFLLMIYYDPRVGHFQLLGVRHKQTIQATIELQHTPKIVEPLLSHRDWYA